MHTQDPVRAVAVWHHSEPHGAATHHMAPFGAAMHCTILNSV